MRRLRESWLALGGSALIIALSVSSALGADPAFDPSNVGQQVSEFARSLAPGQNRDADEPDAEEEDQPDLDEDEQLDEADDVTDETDEDALVTDEDLEPGDEGFDWTTVSHGFCVSWHAQEDENAEENLPEEGEEWNNHGEFVSHWARIGCNESPDETDEDSEAAAAADEDGERAEKAKKEKQDNGRNGNGRGRGGRR